MKAWKELKIWQKSLIFSPLISLISFFISLLNIPFIEYLGYLPFFIHFILPKSVVIFVESTFGRGDPILFILGYLLINLLFWFVISYLFLFIKSKIKKSKR